MSDQQYDAPVPAITQLEVINRNNFAITDMFDGVPISFPPFAGDPNAIPPIPPGQVITVTTSMAMHFFGFPGDPADMATHMARRYGWAGRDYIRPEGLNNALPRYAVLAGNIEIRPVYFDLVRRNQNEPIPADDGSEPDNPREPAGGEPDTSAKVGRRKRTPAKFGGTPRVSRDRPRLDKPAGTRAR